MATPVNITVTIPQPWWGDGSNWKPVYGPGIAVGSATSTALTNFSFASDNSLVVVSADGTDLHVKGDVDIQFVFPQKSGTIPAFYPIGIGYYRENAGQNSMQELDSLPVADIRLGTTTDGSPFVLLHDNDTERDSADGSTKAQWKYYILVQDNFGRLGVIDPDIENDYQDS